MKIIGKTKNGYILETDNYELDRLIGYYNDDDARHHGYGLNIGDDISISKMYDQFYSLKQNEIRFKEVVENINLIANSLILVDPVIRQLQIEIEENNR